MFFCVNTCVKYFCVLCRLSGNRIHPHRQAVPCLVELIKSRLHLSFRILKISAQRLFIFLLAFRQIFLILCLPALNGTHPPRQVPAGVPYFACQCVIFLVCIQLVDRYLIQKGLYLVCCILLLFVKQFVQVIIHIRQFIPPVYAVAYLEPVQVHINARLS